jgi:hypothetical protein
MNLVDLVIVLLVAAAALHGLYLGAAIQVASFAGLGAGLALGAALAPTVSRLANDTGTRVVLTSLTTSSPSRRSTWMAGNGDLIAARAVSARQGDTPTPPVEGCSTVSSISASWSAPGTGPRPRRFKNPEPSWSCTPMAAQLPSG